MQTRSETSNLLRKLKKGFEQLDFQANIWKYGTNSSFLIIFFFEQSVYLSIDILLKREIL